MFCKNWSSINVVPPFPKALSASTQQHPVLLCHSRPRPNEVPILLFACPSKLQRSFAPTTDNGEQRRATPTRANNIARFCERRPHLRVWCCMISSSNPSPLIFISSLTIAIVPERNETRGCKQPLMYIRHSP